MVVKRTRDDDRRTRRTPADGARKKKSSRNHGSQGGGGLALFPGAIGRLTTGASVRRLLTGFHAGSEAFAGVPADECFYGPQRHAEACSRCGLAHVVSFSSGRPDGKRTFRLPCLTTPQPGFPSTRREDMERRIPGQERFQDGKLCACTSTIMGRSGAGTASNVWPLPASIPSPGCRQGWYVASLKILQHHRQVLPGVNIASHPELLRDLLRDGRLPRVFVNRSLLALSGG